MKLIKKFRKIIILVCIIILTIVYLYVENNWIDIENYQLHYSNLPSKFDGFKIVQISDVHLPKNASNIENIIKLTKKQEPDIIIISGDIIDQSADLETCGLEELCKGLSEICKVYAVTGNHEFWNDNIESWKSIIQKSGVVFLDNDYRIIEKNGEKIAVMGLKDDEIYDANIFNNDELKSCFKILISHRPELYNSYISQDVMNPDVVFTGHAHGGQIRIPFLGGLVAPDQGFLPQYTTGKYKINDTVNMIVSRGLGNSVIPFRVNNRPSIPVVTLHTK